MIGFQFFQLIQFKMKLMSNSFLNMIQNSKKNKILTELKIQTKLKNKLNLKVHQIRVKLSHHIDQILHKLIVKIRQKLTKNMRIRKLKKEK